MARETVKSVKEAAAKELAQKTSEWKAEAKDLEDKVKAKYSYEIDALKDANRNAQQYINEKEQEITDALGTTPVQSKGIIIALVLGCVVLAVMAFGG